MTDAAPGPLVLHRDRVRPEWIDYNGHMSEAYYVLVFGDATDRFLDHIGLDAAGRARTQASVYTLEAHISYLAETHLGEAMTVRTQLLDHDAKRLHLFHSLHRDTDETLLATTELMLMHVDMAAERGGPRAAPFGADAAAIIAEIAGDHASLPRPKQAGRAIGIKRG
jgi:acyl-CoA thioester hydrolase